MDKIMLSISKAEDNETIKQLRLEYTELLEDFNWKTARWAILLPDDVMRTCTNFTRLYPIPEDSIRFGMRLLVTFFATPQAPKAPLQ
jgi:hypothetical protein